MKIPQKLSYELKSRIQAAKMQADTASKLPIGERLSEYSFIARFKGKICSPRKISKEKLKRFNKTFVKKYNIDISLDDSDDSDNF